MLETEGVHVLVLELIEGETLAHTDAAGHCRYVPDAELRRICAKTGMVFQLFYLFPHLTAAQNIMLGLMKSRGRSKAEARAIAAEPRALRAG